MSIFFLFLCLTLLPRVLFLFSLPFRRLCVTWKLGNVKYQIFIFFILGKSFQISVRQYVYSDRWLCYNTEIKFEKIYQSINISAIDSNDLSTDQLYLKHICQAVAEGQYSPSLAKRVPGKMAHSRLLTTANRVLRLYIVTN